MGLKRMADRLGALGCEAEPVEGGINIDIDEKKIFVEFDADWTKAVKDFYKARQYRYEPDLSALFSNREAEYLVARLDPGFYHRVDHLFTDGNENCVTISPASKEFLLSYFESRKYEAGFNRIKERISRRYRVLKRPPRRGGEWRQRFRPDDLLFRFHTATYTAKRKPRKQKIEDVALGRIKACLFALAYKKNESWELSHEIKAKGLLYPTAPEGDDEALEIPSADYDSSTVTYYKVAKSSQFPSQVFLSYYHILEFHFLRVADESLYSAVSSQINDPCFKASYTNVNKLLATIKRNDTTVDEKEMLLGVARKYVAEEDFIDFIEKLENDVGEKVFSSKNQKIFGKTFTIRLENGHALSNVASVLKHIRNALVHSSDRYSREDCFLPLSESETLVIKYLPLVQYWAEKVIFATANT